MPNLAGKNLNPVGWGYSEEALTPKERESVLKIAGGWFGGRSLEARSAPEGEDVELPPSRIRIPPALSDLLRQDHESRLLHAVGRSFRDLATLRSRKLEHAPDAVALPRSSDELQRVLEWADRERYAVIPYGAGSSVVGGINAEGMDEFGGVITLSLRGMSRVLDVDETSQTVHAEAGIRGPELDAALKPHGLAIRHYPQSYFFSSLGGWVATRGAGHFSTHLAKIEDRVQALGVTLPDGRRVETRRLPASSVGPDPNRMWCGSEGFLGVITDAHLRCVKLPVLRVNAGVRFPKFEQALAASRAMLQSGIYPTQLRILDPFEHMLSRAFSGKAASGALMVLAFESAGAPLNEVFAAAQDICRANGGEVQSKEGAKEGDDAVGDWRNTFFRQPYIRDAMMDYGVISDTFETAVPWAAAPGFYHTVRDATLKAVQKVCGFGAVTCRSTHAYSDGLSLYFAFFGPGRHDSLVDQWWEIKNAASEAVMKHGGTMSHHHAMGRDHQRWAHEEIPAPFRAAMRAAKRELDPHGILNPGLWFKD